MCPCVTNCWLKLDVPPSAVAPGADATRQEHKNDLIIHS